MKNFLGTIFAMFFCFSAAFAEETVVTKTPELLEQKMEWMEHEKKANEMMQKMELKMQELEYKEKLRAVEEQKQGEVWNVIDYKWSYLEFILGILTIGMAFGGFFGYRKFKEIEKNLKKESEEILKSAQEKDNKMSEMLEKREEEEKVNKKISNNEILSPEEKENVKERRLILKIPSGQRNYEEWRDLGFYFLEKKDYHNAQQAFEKSIQENPEESDSWFGLGTSLGLLGDNEMKDEDKKIKYEESIEKFEKAAGINPKREEIFYNWGTVLLLISHLSVTPLAKKEELWNEVIDKYKIFSKINPQRNEADYNWGCTLIYLAQLETTPLEGKETLLQESIEKLQKVVKINPKKEEAFYNLSVAYNLHEEYENAKNAMESYKKLVSTIEKEKFEKESDFENFKTFDPEWWKKFFETK